MTTIANALSELGITEWVLRGEPTTEAEFNEMFRKVTGADANGTAIESTDHGIAWATVAAKRDELIAAQPMKQLRAERDRKLAETDWWAVADRTMTAEQTAYRQALRDITNSYTSLDDVVWPTKP
jgi:UDP-N-acetyl-D-mannosaminuronate dehydrogenase